MKKITLLILTLATFSFCYAQPSFPFDFEDGFLPFIPFDNGATVANVSNPDTNGNPSTNVIQFDRVVGSAWYSGFIFDQALSPTPIVNVANTGKVFQMKVWSSKPNVVIRFLLEQGSPNPGVSPSYEVFQTVTNANEWVTLTFDFSATPLASNMAYNAFTIFPDWNPADQSNVTVASTYYFDDIITLNDAEPTCDDGIQNGNETGVDCGGPDCAPCVVPTIEGEWKMAPIAGAFEVGPSQGSGAFFSNGLDQVALRDCYFDDLFVFNTDGSFENQDQGVTWLETWQGVAPEQCGPSVAPHDNSNPATWVYDEVAGTLTLNGTGAYIGLPKAVNGGELPGVAVPASRTYLVSQLTATSLVVDIQVGGAWWRFRLQKEVVPTCNDGIQNGDEVGVDCGGSTCAPCADPGDLTQLIGNGSFETGDFTDWEVAGAGIVVVSTNPSEGNFAAHLNNTTTAASRSIKSANRGIGIVNPGDELTIKFDMRGTTAAGGILFVELLSEFEGGGASQQLLSGGPLFPNADPNVWTPYEFTVNAGANVGGGVSLLFNAVTGGDSGSTASIFIDNVSMINNDEVLSIDDVTPQFNLKVFPNPSQTEWTVNASNGVVINTIQLFDVLGKQVLSITPNNTTAKIDASQLTKGLYFANIVSDNGTSTVKLIKN